MRGEGKEEGGREEARRVGEGAEADLIAFVLYS
jgi:hypothetical protein